MRHRSDRQPSRYRTVDAHRIRSRSRRRLAYRPGLEAMETRVVLSPTIYTVDSTGSTTAGTGTSGTLPYVISLANADPNPDGSEVMFDPTVFASSQTINVGTGLPLDESPGPEVLEGPGAALLSITGDGLNIQGTARLSGLTITQTHGIEIGGTATLVDCTLSGNSGSVDGAIYNEGNAMLTGCTISDNSSPNYGGGLFNDFKSTLTLTGCTIVGNAAANSGGGVFNLGTASLTDCTISGNTAAETGGGLANRQYSGATLALNACTIVGNFAGSIGGGLANAYHSTMSLTDTIVAGNVGGLDVVGGHGEASDVANAYGAGVTGTHDLIGPGGSGGIVGGSDGNIVLTSLDGLSLGPLADNGGPTQTMALLPGSPAIGAGTAVAGVTTDQRGMPLDSPPDIGAYQVGTLAVASIAPVTPDPRNTPLTSVIVTLNKPAGSVGIGTAALSLSDDGGPNLINGDVTITLVSGSTYRIGGLSSLTTIEGSYTLTVDAADITDPGGNPGAGSQSTSWLMDTTPPTSGLDELPSEIDATSFTINVTAFDAPGPGALESSGLATIAIYFSTDGGRYVLFTTVPPGDPSTTFTGQPGNTYSFYSIATDEAGNVQPTPQFPQATIRVNGQPAAVVGQEPIFPKLNKKGKPVGKDGVSGFRIGFNAPLMTTTAIDPANYQVDALVTHKAGRKVQHILRPIANFQVSYDAAAETVTITLRKPQTFRAGGQIAILPGVTNGGGVPVIPPTVLTISKGGRSVIAPL